MHPLESSEPRQPCHPPTDKIRRSNGEQRDRVPGGIAFDRLSPLASPLTTARKITSFQDIEYPEGVRSPSDDLNKDAKDGKFRYDRDFLMQFMQLCKERPPNLPPLDTLGIEPVDQSTFSMTRGGSGRHRQPTNAMPPTTKSSLGFGIASGFSTHPGPVLAPFAMGQFSTATSKLTSGHPIGSKRARSKRSDRRKDANKVAHPLEASNSSAAPRTGSALGAPKPVVPPEMSADHRVTSSTDTDSLELVDRRVRDLLNQITMDRFDFISDEIIAWVDKSKNETDGRTLIRVTKLVFEKATDVTVQTEVYARLCRKMMETISPDVQNQGIKNTEGKPITGGRLFRKYLLTRCQEDFDHRWAAKRTTAAATAAKASDDQATKAANEKKGDENELYSDEYYAAQKAKRQGLGLIKFIGELFKLQILTERIMHECVKTFLVTIVGPEEDKIERLCQLLKTVGQLLDVPKAKGHMDVYLTRMKDLGKNPNVNPRIQFMLQDVIELRDRKWVVHNAVHEVVEKGATGHYGDRNIESGPDSWTRTGGQIPCQQPKAGDLSQFGKISKDAPMVMRPSSVFTEKYKKREPFSSSSKLLPIPSHNSGLAFDSTTSTSERLSREPSEDFGRDGVPELSEPRNRLLPKAKRTPAKEVVSSASVDEHGVLVRMSGDDTKEIDNNDKVPFAVRSLEEAFLRGL